MKRMVATLLTAVGVSALGASLAEEPERSKYTLRSMRCSVDRHPERPTFVTRIAIHVGYKEANRRIWLPVEASVHDSAGKEWVPDRWGIDDVTEKGYVLNLEAEDDAKELPTGWQDRTKWVVRMSCASPPKSGSEITLTLPVIQMPKSDEVVQVPLDSRIAAKELVAAVACGKEADAPAYSLYSKGEANLYFQLKKGGSRWPTVRKLVDEKNRKIKSYLGRTLDDDAFLLIVNSVGKSKSMKLTLGLDPIERVRFSF